jgi:CubicO group peptidase (beta-lactamase class C family)
MDWRLTWSIICAAHFLSACSVPQPAPFRGALVGEVSDSRLDSYLQEMAAKEHFSGAALVMREGNVVHAKGYGLATGNRANQVDTAFHVGSITKQFTAAAILQLVEKGVLKLDDPINIHLPPRFRSAPWSEVTVHHLLSHTSGIADYGVARDYYHLVKGFCSRDTVEGMVKEAMGKDLAFAPGSNYSYTNLGYTLLGIIIENETSKSFDDYIKENIFDPMAMRSSKFDSGAQDVAEDAAEGLRWNGEMGKHVPDDIVLLPATAPDGGLITTLDDFVRWTRIFTAGDQTILSQASIHLMTSPHIRIGNGGPLDSMGYGLFVGDRLIGHGGLVVGFTSQFVFDRETRSLIVVFSNDATDDPQRVAFGLLTLLLTPSTAR